jgi:hypothetical protein
MKKCLTFVSCLSLIAISNVFAGTLDTDSRNDQSRSCEESQDRSSDRSDDRSTSSVDSSDRAIADSTSNENSDSR